MFFASTRIRIFLQKGDNVFQVSRCCCNFAVPKRSPGKCRYFQNPEYEETIKDYVVRSNERLSDSYSLLKLQPADGSAIIDTCAGQFVEVEVSDSKSTFLRRPISINFVDRDRNELWLLVRVAGEGTRHLVALAEGRVLSLVLPLGKGFSIPADTVSKVLLAGGGVGVAPMLYLGSELKKRGFEGDRGGLGEFVFRFGGIVTAFAVPGTLGVYFGMAVEIVFQTVGH